MNSIKQLCILIFISIGLADYTIQNPPYPDIHWNDVEMVNDSSAIAVGGNGDSGVISRTTDLGQTWDHQFYGGGNWGEIEFNDVEFLDDQNGWVAGSTGNLLKTWNGGNSWLFSEVPTSVDLTTIEFVNNQVGYLGGNQGWENYEIYKTTDGGEIWEYISDGPYRISNIDFIGENEGWIATTGDHMQHTTDGGLTWQYVIPEPDFAMGWSDIDFIDENHGWVTSLDGCMDASCGWQYRTVDGGETWEDMSDDWGLAFMPRLGFFNENDGWGIQSWYNGWGGKYGNLIQKTTDGRYSWSWTENLYSETITALDFFDDISGMSVGSRGVSLFSQDGAESWQRNAYTGDLKSIFFLDENTGWAGGANGTMLKTEDGGTTWNTQSMNYNFTDNYWFPMLALDIFFPSEMTGFVAAANHGLFKTQNGGETWQQVYLGEYDINKVWFISELIGWAIGDGIESSAIIYTEDSGETWVEQHIFDGYLVALSDLQFIDSQLGWVAGQMGLDGGFISKTTNGGADWQMEVIEEFQQICTLHFLNEQEGWITVKYAENSTIGAIMKTTDGGAAWTTQYEATSFYPGEMVFSDALNGVTNDFWNNELFHTIDGGESWQIIDPGLGWYTHPTDIAMVQPGQFWISANKGYILKFDMEAGITLGDVNQDGDINVLDILRIVIIILIGGATDYEQLAADMNQDELINIQDILLIVQIVLEG